MVFPVVYRYSTGVPCTVRFFARGLKAKLLSPQSSVHENVSFEERKGKKNDNIALALPALVPGKER